MESSTDKGARQAGSARPSLLQTPGGAQAQSTPQTRLLAAIEREDLRTNAQAREGRTGRTRHGLTALLLVVGLVAGAGLLGYPLAEPAISGATLPSALISPPVVPGVSPVAATLPPTAASDTWRAQIELGQPAPPPRPPLIVAEATSPDAAASRSAGPTESVSPLASGGSPPMPAVSPVARAGGSGGTVEGGRAVKTVVPKPLVVKQSGARVASTQRRPHKPDTDADTELVAAIIARLDKRGAEPFARPVSSTPRDGGAAAALAVRLQHCAMDSDALLARQCRAKACEGHWGVAAACPPERAPGKASGAPALGSERG
jgi:hypothetical protein